MKQLLEKTISEIVIEHHTTASVFEKYGIDFCCKGKRPLAEAIGEKKLNAEELVGDLEKAIATTAGSKDYNSWSLSMLVDHIEQVHHHYVRSAMPQILAYLSKVVAKHGDRFPYMKEVQLIFSELQIEMMQHMMKEEKILFPRIKNLEADGAGNTTIQQFRDPIDIMEEEHDVAGKFMEDIRELTNDYTPPAGACTTFQLLLSSLKAFEQDLHIHVHLENHILFPKTMQLFQQSTTLTC